MLILILYILSGVFQVAAVIVMMAQAKLLNLLGSIAKIRISRRKRNFVLS
jgi:hypothetical protein